MVRRIVGNILKIPDVMSRVWFVPSFPHILIPLTEGVGAETPTFSFAHRLTIIGVDATNGLFARGQLFRLSGS
jgi:hypothetical protein